MKNNLFLGHFSQQNIRFNFRAWSSESESESTLSAKEFVDSL